MSRQFWVILAVIVVGTAIYYPFSPGGRQQRNMDRAARHIPAIKAQIAGDARFADITLNPYTGNGGSLLVLGEVPSEDDVEALKAIVAKTNPPTPVAFVVRPASNLAVRPK